MDLLNKYYTSDIVMKLLNEKFMYLKLGSVEVNCCGNNNSNNFDHLPSVSPPEQLVYTTKSIDRYIKRNAGFYFDSPSEDIYKATTSIDTFYIFVTLYLNAMLKSDCNMLYNFHMKDYERIFQKDLHRFKYCLFEEELGIYLELIQHYTSVLDKKILIISSMVDTMKFQLNNLKKIFPNYEIKTENIIFYKSFNTIEGNDVHSNWYETFCIMRDDIHKLDFDYCFLGCGSYGPPLADYIYSEMNRSAFAIGATIQLLFGIIGKRWEGRLHNENYFYRRYRNEYWIKPFDHEIPNNFKNVEDGCYW